MMEGSGNHGNKAKLSRILTFTSDLLVVQEEKSPFYYKYKPRKQQTTKMFTQS